MQDLPPLDGLSNEAKDVLIRQLWEELQSLRAEVEKLKHRRIKKTSKNSSLPPAKGFKPNQATKAATKAVRQGSLGRTGGGRELTLHPHQGVIEA